MEFYGILEQMLDLLRSRGRVSYRGLKRHFDLDDEAFEDLKEAILFDNPQVEDEGGRGLVWVEPSVAVQGVLPADPVAASPPTGPWVSDPQAYTPPHLAAKILTSRAALRGERKQVTVLFCDLVNSTGMADDVGEEAMHEVLNHFFKLALDAIHQYEGNVNQFLGDGFMALFGAPIAHEDHARRAVFAALELRRKIGAWNEAETRQREARITVRMGLNTGSVVVGAIGDNLRVDYTAVGDTTNVAARLEGQAAPDQIIISETTCRLVEGYCRLRSLGTLGLKGKSAPQPAWEVVAASDAVTRFDIEVGRGLTPFTSRERELRTLHECFEQARAGCGHMLLMVGDPGVGKSRLLLEFRRRLDGADRATWLEGRALSFGWSTAFHPVIDMLRRCCGIDGSDSETTIIAKIERQTQALPGPAGSVAPYLRHLLAVDPGDEMVRCMDPQLRRGELFRALQRFLFHASESHPKVILLEDIHWMDQATQNFLASVADSIPAHRVLFLLTYRPGYSPPFGERTWQTRLALLPLSTTHSVQIATTMLGVDDLPDDLANLLTRKTEGNPFFVEQVVRSLQDVGAIRRIENRCMVTGRIEDASIPETIQDILAARIDRLPEAQKATLQVAAVIGREFTYRLLARLETDPPADRLRELAAIEMVYEIRPEPDRAYAFGHALTPEVVYNSLLAGRRRDLHRLIGEAIEELDAHRLVEHAETLAHHFERAEAWDRALRHLLQAGRKAQQASALKEALGFHERALAVCERLGSEVDPATHMSIHASKGEAHFIRSEFPASAESYRQALAIARRNGDRKEEARALYHMGLAYHWAHEFERALQCSESARSLASELDVRSTVAASTFVIGWVHAVLGDLDEALRHLDDALRTSREVEDEEQEGFSLFVLGQIWNWKGEFVRALQLLDQALRIGRTRNLPFLVAGVLWMGGRGIRTWREN